MTDRIQTPVGWFVKGLGDFCFRLVIEGRPITLKNSKSAFPIAATANPKSRIRCPKCKTGLRVSTTVANAKPADAWMKMAVEQLEQQWKTVFANPIPQSILLNTGIVTYFQTKKMADQSNSYQGPEDAMEKAGVIGDDVQIETHDGSRRLIDKDRPRVEITLTPWRAKPWTE